MSFMTELGSRIRTWAEGKFAVKTLETDVSNLSGTVTTNGTTMTNHINATNNPHATTKTHVGLGNVTNDAQVKKSASSTNGNIPTWNGTTGDSLAAGYGVTTNGSTSWSALTSSLATAKAIQDKVDLALQGSSAFLPPVQDVTALKALNTTNDTSYPDKAIINVENSGLYRLDRDSSEVENGVNIVAPTTGVGRWYRIANLFNSHRLLSGLQGGDVGLEDYYHLDTNTFDATIGTAGTPSGANKFVTQTDPKLTHLNSTTGTFPVAEITFTAGDSTEFLNALNGS
jgi:hypothetical protein